jgi:hypothetical protein
MKTLKPIQTRKNQTINNSLTLKNQKVMKTKKYSISMKALAAVVFTFAFSAFLNAQFVPPSPVFGTQTAEEVRATTSVTYDLSGTHTAGDTYRWAVRGGVITGGTPVGPDSSILGWTADIPLITVTWNTDITGTPIGSAPGEVIVQKRAGGTCASELQVLDILMWNPATANLDLTGLVAGICSGEAIAFTVPVDLTGAPDPGANNGFDVAWEYEVTAGTLTDLSAGIVDGLTGTAFSNTELAQIPLPNGLLNTGAGDATFVVRLTAMQDDFNVVGVVGATFEYQFTVYETPATGDIISTPAGLVRR